MLVALSLNLWWGKAVGLMLGWMLSGWAGGMLGLLLGHVFDQRLRLEPFTARGWRDCRPPEADVHYLAAVFGYLGKVLALGPQRPAQLVEIEQFMDELELDEAQRGCARRFIAHGIEREAPVRALGRWLDDAEGSRERREWLLVCLCRVAAAGGAPSAAQQRFLSRLARRLGIDIATMGYRWAGRRDAPESELAASSFIERGLDDAFRLLGIDAFASAAEIKQAYRRAVARHHPDRLLAQGASEPQIREATQLTREIRLAYDDIRSARGF